MKLTTWMIPLEAACQSVLAVMQLDIANSDSEQSRYVMVVAIIGGRLGSIEAPWIRQSIGRKAGLRLMAIMY